MQNKEGGLKTDVWKPRHNAKFLNKFSLNLKHKTDLVHFVSEVKSTLCLVKLHALT